MRIVIWIIMKIIMRPITTKGSELLWESKSKLLWKFYDSNAKYLDAKNMRIWIRNKVKNYDEN